MILLSRDALSGQLVCMFIVVASRFCEVINHLLNQSIAGTVIAKASVETRSMEAASDWTALYRAANSTATIPPGNCSTPGPHARTDYRPATDAVARTELRTAR